LRQARRALDHGIATEQQQEQPQREISDRLKHGAPGRQDYFFFGIYRSVMLPSNTSALIPTDSLSVGCGWIVWPMSPASQPISIASVISAIRSPACTPTTPPPITRCVTSSKISLVKPSVRPRPIARPEAAHGNFATPTFRFFAFASDSVTPTQAISGSV